MKMLMIALFLSVGSVQGIEINTKINVSPITLEGVAQFVNGTITLSDTNTGRKFTFGSSQNVAYAYYFNSNNNYVEKTSIDKRSYSQIKLAANQKCPFIATVERDLSDLTIDLDCDLME